MQRIAGADGSRDGWVVVWEDIPSQQVRTEIVRSLQELFSRGDSPDILALDIPIGLTSKGARACDLEARAALGGGRGSSVFPAPIRAVLDADSHLAACEIGRRVEGKGLSIQAWGIVKKIKEVDSLLRSDPALRPRIREVHPEVCFCVMGGGRPMVFAKKKAAGREERATLLRQHFGSAVDSALADRERLRCAPDDLLDAFAALWTARRIARGEAITLPDSPPTDEYGLRMEIVA